MHLGPENSPEIQNLKKLIEQYNVEWGGQVSLDENFVNRETIIKKIFPEIKAEIQSHVDQIISIELDNLYDKLKITRKKEPKPKKPTISKPPKVPGETLVKDQSLIDIYKELITLHIWRKDSPKRLKDFYTTENLIKTELQQEEGMNGVLDPSLS